MNFVTRTRLVQYADLVNGTQTVLASPTVFRTGPVGTIYLTMTEAMAAVPAGQRPAEVDWWKYQLQYLVQAYVLPTIRGVRPDTPNLVFDVDFWVDQATHDAGTPAQRRNTFEYQVGNLAKTDIQAQLVSQVDDYLMQAEFGNFPVDDRNPSIPTTTDPAHDPKSLLTKQAVINANNTPRSIPSTWRTF